MPSVAPFRILIYIAPEKSPLGILGVPASVPMPVLTNTKMAAPLQQQQQTNPQGQTAQAQAQKDVDIDPVAKVKQFLLPRLKESLVVR